MATEGYSSIIKSATVIMICTVAYKLLGFLREFLLSYFFGTSGISDAFLISLTIPGTLFEFVGTGLATCFIPIFFSIVSEQGLEKANVFTNKVTTLIFTFSTLLILLVWIDTPLFVKIFASGFKDETFDLACDFTRIGILSLYFSALVFVYGSYLQAHKVFLPNSITAVFQSSVVLFAIYVGAKYSLYAMCIICALSIGARLFYIYPSVKRYGLRLRLNFQWNDSYLKRLGYLLIPVVLGCAVNDLNVIFDRTIASQVTVGAISALTYGNSLIQLANGGIVQPVATVYFPYITKFISEGKADDASTMLRKTLSIMTTLFLLITILFLIYSRQITEALFGRGAFDETAVNLTTSALFYYSTGLIFIAYREVISRYYYANGDTKTPMYNAAIGVLFNIVLNVVLAKYMGVGGLALATSISALVTSLLLVINTKRKLNLGISNYIEVKEWLKSLVAGIIVAVIAIFTIRIIEVRSIIHLILHLTGFSVLYLGLCYFLKVQNVIMGLEWVKNKTINKLNR